MLKQTISIGVLIATATMAISGAATKAVAADLDSAYGGLDPIAEQRVEFGTGFYVRGDIAGARGTSVKTADDPYDYMLQNYSAINASGTTTTETLPQGIFLGPGQSPPTLSSGGSHPLVYDGTLGAGYQFNRWFRADVTFDFHQPVANSYRGAARPCVTGESLLSAGNELPVTAICTPTLSASLKSYGALVNGYFDLGTWSIVTPYVGAGVGLSFGHASASAHYLQNNGQPYQITYTDAVSNATYYQNWDRSTGLQYYNVAFALMAGVSFDVFDHTKLDIGYRYLHLGEVLGTNLSFNEVRAGLRYMIDD